MTTSSYLLLSAPESDNNKSVSPVDGPSPTTATTTPTHHAPSASKPQPQTLGLGLPSSLPQGPRKRTSSFSVHTSEPLRKYQKMTTSTATLAPTATLSMMDPPQSSSPAGGLRRCASHVNLNTLATYPPQASSSTTSADAEVPYKRSLRYQLDQRNRRRAISSRLPSSTPSSPSMLTFPSFPSSEQSDCPEPPMPPAPPSLQDHAIPLKVKCKVTRKVLPQIQIPTPTRPVPPPPNGNMQPTPTIRHSSPPPPPCDPIKRPLSPLCPDAYAPSVKQGPTSSFFATFANPRRPRGRPESNWVKVALVTRLRQTDEGRRVLRVGPRRAIDLGLLNDPNASFMLTDFDTAWREGEELRQSLGLCSDMGMGYDSASIGGYDLSEATRELEEMVADQERRCDEMGLLDMDMDDDVEEETNATDETLVSGFSSPYLSPAYSLSSTSLTLAELNFTPSSPSLPLTCPPSPALTFASSDSFGDSDSDDEEDKDAEGEPDPDVFMFDAPVWPASFAKAAKAKQAKLDSTSPFPTVTPSLTMSLSSALPSTRSISKFVKRKPVAHNRVQAEEEERDGWNLVAYPFQSLSMALIGTSDAAMSGSMNASGWEVIERSQAVVNACA